jgi:hypothetical protein
VAYKIIYRDETGLESETVEADRWTDSGPWIEFTREVTGMRSGYEVYLDQQVLRIRSEDVTRIEQLNE